jgi:hypothetical protein
LKAFGYSQKLTPSLWWKISPLGTLEKYFEYSGWKELKIYEEIYDDVSSQIDFENLMIELRMKSVKFDEIHSDKELWQYLKKWEKHWCIHNQNSTLLSFNKKRIDMMIIVNKEFPKWYKKWIF